MCIFLLGLSLGWSAGPDFNREIRPILSDHCFRCHGPDAGNRQANLRLDDRAAALKGGDSGPALTPGQPTASLLLTRIHATDVDQLMPPPAANKPLSDAQKERLAVWIAAGAEYQIHWAFVPVQRPLLPTVKQSHWPTHPIDRFVLARLEPEGLTPSPEADRPTLIRRLSLDLLGLPPTPAEVDAFLSDRAVGAVERLVDRLLDSVHVGERFASDWLDAARFADSNGYQVDRDREMHHWRDWVIAAINRDLPFDQFTIEQLAGDLLPNPTREQRIATGFHRNHMMNEEGGIIPEEFLAEYTADRVETTAAVWLGQTFHCARCHDHKYDPFTQRDFYSLKAFFHNITESGLGRYGDGTRKNAPPYLTLPTTVQETDLARIKSELLTANQELALVKQQVARSVRDRFIVRLPIHPVGPAVGAGSERYFAIETEPAVALTLSSQRVKSLTARQTAIEAAIETTLVMDEMPKPRTTNILRRGEYTQLGTEVTADTPTVLPAMDSSYPKNRLGLARWLVDRTNPLTSRVIVNRYWQSLFGVGLVRTAEDFGAQGEAPSHPELLDWLASEFVDSGWSVKRLLRLIATSSTYRQASRLTPDRAAKDPDNRLLSRGPRHRLQAEFVRDQALFVSGLLDATIGGPSVKPYHPPGLYELVVAGRGPSKYVEDKGANLYRRSLYTYWKRSVPNPSLLLFDMPFRESCTLRRPRSNTPLQALNLMNDPTYVEAARRLAEQLLQDETALPAARIDLAYRRVLARSPSRTEVQLHERSLRRLVDEYRQDPDAAKALIAVGAAKPDPARDPAELAAHTLFVNLLLNLDEAINKE